MTASQTAPDTREAIMEATFRALSEHGYSDLRVRDIGEEFEKSRTLIHYHFDGKHDLISSFLEYLIGQYESQSKLGDDENPWEALDGRIDQCLLGPELGERFDHWERMKVYHELFAQAQHNEAHREAFNEHYEVIRGNIEHVLRAGIERGSFRAVDVEDTSQFITDVIHAARARRISLDHDDAPEQAKRAIAAFVYPSLAPADAEGARTRRPSD
ncbi:TetR/AcrR family transcriptional regulator [Halorussus marinus]|uniref:TetR/AcrR family transcriptional regulator n=1 Tax=Halorussus marinus TaxID=2505976 RepID=UPI001B2FF7D9|nr:TetR/AcrR family transcriptional regulator [Halorussus marinus]